MIAYLKGEIISVSETRLVLDVGNIGYQIFISARDAAEMPAVGTEVKIYTYLYHLHVD